MNMSYRTERTAHLRRAVELRERKRLRRQRAVIHAALEHCRAKSKTRKRSVEKLMAERGYERADYIGPVERQWIKA